MRSATVKIAADGFAASELEIRREVIDEFDEPDVRAALEAFDGKHLHVTPENAESIARGLNELSNLCDDLATTAPLDADEKRANRAASKGLATLMSKVRRAHSKPPKSADERRAAEREALRAPKAGYSVVPVETAQRSRFGSAGGPIDEKITEGGRDKLFARITGGLNSRAARTALEEIAARGGAIQQIRVQGAHLEPLHSDLWDGIGVGVRHGWLSFDGDQARTTRLTPLGARLLAKYHEEIERGEARADALALPKAWSVSWATNELWRRSSPQLREWLNKRWLRVESAIARRGR